ncbi:MAG: hypothetical protein PVI80_03120, partial [Anaerolineae bacterium]
MNKIRLFNDFPLPALATAAPARSMPGAGPEEPWGPHRLLASSGGSSDDEGKRTVRARRRRRSKSDSERKRAEAPRRKRAGEERRAAPPPSTASATGQRPRPRPAALPSLPFGRGPGGRRSPLLIIGLLVVLCICVAGSMLFLGPGGSDEVAYTPPTSTPVPLQAAVTEPPPASPEPFVPPSTSTEGQTWLVMLYQDADDKILEHDIYVDLNEAERAGSSDRVHVVAQVDRYRAGYRGDGDWTSTKRFYVNWDDDLQRVQSQQVEDLGELNMSDGETLVDFVTWAVET